MAILLHATWSSHPHRDVRVGMSSGAPTAAPDAASQWLFSRDDLQHTPSVTGKYTLLAGSAESSRTTSQTMSSEQERTLRAKGVHLIFKMGEFLQVGTHVMVAAATYFHRFYMRRPLQVNRASGGWSHYEMAATCVFLACKSEESLRKVASVVDAAMSSLDKTPEGQARWADRSFRANHASHEYAKWRDCILLHEEALMTTLCFDLVVPQPHEILVRSTQRLQVAAPLARLAWTVLNDCMRDPTCLFFDAPVLAGGAFLKACRESGIDPAMYYAARPLDAPPVDADDNYFDWLDVFDLDENEALAAVEAIERDVYGFHKPPPRGSSAKASGERKSAKPPVAAEAAEAAEAAGDTTLPAPPSPLAAPPDAGAS